MTCARFQGVSGLPARIQEEVEAPRQELRPPRLLSRSSKRSSTPGRSEEVAAYGGSPRATALALWQDTSSCSRATSGACPRLRDGDNTNPGPMPTCRGGNSARRSEARDRARLVAHVDFFKQTYFLSKTNANVTAWPTTRRGFFAPPTWRAKARTRPEDFIDTRRSSRTLIDRVGVIVRAPKPKPEEEDDDRCRPRTRHRAARKWRLESFINPPEYHEKQRNKREEGGHAAEAAVHRAAASATSCSS